MLSILYRAILVTGFIFCVKIVTQVTYWLIKSIYVFYISKPVKFRGAGGWAVVTGCTDGIGKAYTEKLASFGFNIVLMSRSQEKLETQSKHLEETFKIATKIIGIDFSYADTDTYNSISQQLGDMDIGVLVNNVGVATEYPLYFCDPENSTVDIHSMLKVNYESFLKMTHILLPGMLARDRGVIINVSSGAGTLSMPLLSIYPACKALMRKFTHALHYECKSSRLIIQTITPYLVCTKMSRFTKSKILIPSTEEFLSQSIRAVGRFSDTTGYFSHEVWHSLRGLLPGWVDKWISFFLLKRRLEYGKKKLQEKKYQWNTH